MSGIIVIAVDGSKGACDAAALGAMLTRKRDARAVLVCVHPPRPLTARPGAGTFEGRDRDAAEWIVDAVPWEGCAPERRTVCAATPALGIGIAAEQERADLVVVGTGHRHGLGRAVLGTTALKLVAELRCPVAVCPTGWRERHPNGRPPAIGVAYDGSDEAREALAVGTDLARTYGGSLELIDAVSPLTPLGLSKYGPAAVFFIGVEPALETAQERVAAALAGLPAGVGATMATPVGEAAERLVAASAHLDLLVMGSHGRGALRRLLLGSASAGVVDAARCPVVVVPPPVQPSSRNR